MYGKSPSGIFLLVRGSNLLGHPTYREDYRPLLHVKMCRAMLRSPSEDLVSWKQLTEAVVDQLTKPKTLSPSIFQQEIEMLWEMGLDFNYKPNGNTILYFMMKNNLVEGVKTILERQASVDDVDNQGRTAIQVAVENQITEIIHLLEENVAGKLFTCSRFVFPWRCCQLEQSSDSTLSVIYIRNGQMVISSLFYLL